MPQRSTNPDTTHRPPPLLNALSYPTGDDEHSLRQLHRWLQYEGLAGVLGGAAAVWIPYALIVLVLTVLAVVFTPYMLWHLGRAGWYKSIAVFGILVGVPFVVSLFATEGTMAGLLLTLGALALFYLYAWGLRYVIGEHLSEQEALRQFERTDRW